MVLNPSRAQAADQLYRRLGSCPAFRVADLKHQPIPERGVYFLFEAGELRPDRSTQRVVRVGTHRKGSLPDRLGHHLGTLAGGGSHRSSIFRSLIGRSMPDGRPQSWGISNRTEAARRAGIAKEDLCEFERSHEGRVSERIRAMTVICLAIDKEADRRAVEQGAIALLSNALREFEPPSQKWAGKRCEDRPLVAASGLWNQHYVRREWSIAFLSLIGDGGET